MEINKVELWQCASSLERAMKDIGVADIKYSTDQEALEQTVATMEKSVLGEHFKKTLQTLPPSKFMWVSAVDHEGKSIAVIAGRLDDIGSWSLQRYLQEHFERVIEGRNRRPAILSKNSLVFANDIRGRCAYLGEGYAVPEWRKTGLVTLLFKFMALITWDEWKPDIIYAWIRRAQVKKGAAAIWGLTETYETPLEFTNPPLDEDWSDTYFAAMRKIGIHQMIRTLKVQAEKSALSNKSESSIPDLF